MSSINFDNPWLLLIAIPIAALFVIPFAIAIRKDNLNGHNIASGVIHIVMALIIAFVAAGTSIITTVTQTDVYVVADVSYSASANLDTVDRYISDLGKSLPDNSRLGVVCFGRDCKLVTKLGERFRTVKGAGVDDSATDIIGALDFTGSLFRDDVIKRIVLITDGKQTNESDQNALKRQVDALADRKIHVDAIYLDDNIKDNAREVQLSGVRYSQTTSLNRENERAEITVNCSCPETKAVNGNTEAYTVKAHVVLRRKSAEETDENYVLIDEDEFDLTRGSNSVIFDLPTDEEGTFDYKAEISSSEDTNVNNNVLLFTQKVSNETKVLLLSQSWDDYDAVAQIYGRDSVDAQYIGNKNVPNSVEELIQYDEIVLSNINLSKDINNTENFLASLDTVVSLFGKSLVTFGNTYVQSSTDGGLRALGNMLPVVFGNNQSDPALYTLVIDVSRSMELLGNLDRAKAAATGVVKLLSDDDWVSLITFDGDSRTVWQRSSLGASRDEILETIDRLTVRQGTDIGAALDAAFEQTNVAQFTSKRVLLFTDGLNFSGGNAAAVQTVKNMRDYGIFTTALDVGRQGVNSNAVNLLKDIAENGGAGAGAGKNEPYDISSGEVVQDVIDQMRADMGELSGDSFIKVKRRADDVMRGVDANLLESDSQYVSNYYISSAKNSATTVLAGEFLPSKDSDTMREAPLYSYWNYGNGKVASFTSRLSGEWVETIDAEQRARLFTNILKTNTPAEKVDYPFLIEVLAEDGYANVTLTPERVRADATARIEISSPDGETVSSSLAFGSTTYNYTFVTPQVGKYAIKITYEYGGLTFTAERTVTVSYSSEYDSFILYDAAALHKAVGANGTVSENGSLTIKNDDGEIGLYNMSLAMPLLIACVVLYAIDIAVRKLKWEDIKSLFKRGRRVK